jgi:hypothetical protein
VADGDGLTSGQTISAMDKQTKLLKAIEETILKIQATKLLSTQKLRMRRRHTDGRQLDRNCIKTQSIVVIKELN